MWRRTRPLLVWALLGLAGCELVSGLSSLEFTSGTPGGAGPGGAATGVGAQGGLGGSGGTSSGGGATGGQAPGGTGGGAAGGGLGAGGSGGGAGAGGGEGGSAGGSPGLIERIFVSKTRFSCAKRGADVFCWGQGRDGDPNILAPEPAVVPDGTLEIGANNPSCARLDSGLVHCWGANDRGQLGDGTTTPRTAPGVAVGLPGLALALSVSSSRWACAVIDAAPAALSCWGSNDGAQLFVPPDSVAHPDPVPIVFSGPPTAVSQIDVADRHGCARLGTAAQCWGHNQSGRLGIGHDTSLYYAPSPLALSEEATDLAVTTDGGCILSTTGEAYCWGTPWTATGTPIAVAALDNSHDLDGGDSHVCAVHGSAAVCAGYNTRLQLGAANPAAYVGWPNVPGDVVQVGAGYEFSCALNTAGEVYCWGSNFAGALGIGSASADNFLAPQLVTFPP